MQNDLIADIGRARTLMKGVFQPCHQRANSLSVQLLRPWRRHHASAELAHCFLEKVRILSDAVRCDTLEAYATDFGLVVVATDAILLDRGKLRFSRSRRDGRRRCGNDSRKAESGDQGNRAFNM